jgi:hypothetical protein
MNGHLMESVLTGVIFHVTDWTDLGKGLIRAVDKHEVGLCSECSGMEACVN